MDMVDQVKLYIGTSGWPYPKGEGPGLAISTLLVELMNLNTIVSSLILLRSTAHSTDRRIPAMFTIG